MSESGLGCAKTPAVAPHVEISLSNCICGSQIILHKRRSMPCRRIVFSTFRGCMSFYTGSGQSRRTNTSDEFAGCPLHLQLLPTLAPLQIDAECQDLPWSPFRVLAKVM